MKPTFSSRTVRCLTTASKWSWVVDNLEWVRSCHLSSNIVKHPKSSLTHTSLYLVCVLSCLRSRVEVCKPHGKVLFFECRSRPLMTEQKVFIDLASIRLQDHAVLFDTHTTTISPPLLVYPVVTQLMPNVYPSKITSAIENQEKHPSNPTPIRGVISSNTCALTAWPSPAQNQSSNPRHTSSAHSHCGTSRTAWWRSCPRSA